MARGPIAAVVQMTSSQDVEDNLRRADRLIERAAERGAELVVLPENFAYIKSLKDKLELAEPLDEQAPGPIVAAMQRTVRRLGLHLLIGGTPIVGPDPGRFYNTSILLDPEGAFLATYRKVHLFDINIPQGAVFTESDWVAPGEALVTHDLLGITLGLSICYDLRFPELYRQLVLGGATALAVPAAFTLHTGKDHWFPLLRARAIENVCHVLAAAQGGWHTPTRATYGKSCIIDPWGGVLAQAPEGEGIAVAELDLEAQAKMRREMPCLEHRKV